MRPFCLLSVLLGGFLIGSIGCGDDPLDPASCDPPKDAAAFEAGSGELCFERVAAGATVPLMSGPQGGYHLFAAVGCTDCGDSARVDVRVLEAATMLPLAGAAESTSLFVNFAGEAWPQAPGLQVPMPGSSWGDPEDVPPAEGTALVIAFSVFDGQGKALLHESSLEVIIGKTQSWDPCNANPDGACCDGGCN